MPIVDGLEAEFAGKVTVVRLNAAEQGNSEIQAGYGVRGHPSVVILDEDGQVVNRYFGGETADTLREALNAVVP
jgi:thioredoxin-like negative regulator of GroEL